MTQPEMQTPSKPIHLDFALSKEELMESQRIGCSKLGSGWVRLNYKAMIPLGILLMVEGAALFFLQVERPIQIFVTITRAPLYPE
jgi:hypothetical protein